MADEQPTKKAAMTDEERLALANKMDKELDTFIDGLEKKRYTEGWPEDRWEEEMDKHPFFMKKAPTEFDDSNPLMAGMQQLKYDPEENSNEDLTQTYKDDGNFYMKHKKYKMSILSYTEALKLNCENRELNATIFNNRSAAHFFLQNYRSSFDDAMRAVAQKPDYPKALWRAAQCASKLSRFDECIDLCDRILGSNAQNIEAINLRAQSVKSKMEQKRDVRKDQVMKKKKETQMELLMEALQQRGVKFEEQLIYNSSIKLEYFNAPAFAPLERFPVHLDENNELVWPIAFNYPEFLFSDFQQQVAESCIMYDVLRELLSDRLECDYEHKYKANLVHVYYENRITKQVFKVKLNITLKELIQQESFFVQGGSILLYVLAKQSHAEDMYLNEKSRECVFH